MEQGNNRRDREINLKSLVIRILLRWRSILLMVLVCCLLGSAYKYFSLNKSSSKSEEEPAAAEQQTSQKDVKYYQDLLNMIDQAIADKKDYVQNSFVGKMDLYNTGMSCEFLYIRETGQGTAAVSTDEEDEPEALDPRIKTITDELLNYVNTGIDWTAYKEENNLGEVYLDELLTTKSFNSGFMVQTFFEDEAGAEKLRDYVIAQVNKEFERIQKAGGFEDFEMIHLNQYTSTVIYDKNTGWLAKQLTDIETLETDRKNAQTSLNAAETISSTKDDSGDSAGLKTVIKTGIKAGLLGFAAMIGLILLSLIYGDKVLSGKEFNDYYNLRSIINLAGNRKNSGEKRILKLEKENQSELSEDIRYELAAANIRKYAPEMVKIGVIGDADAQLMNDICNKLGSLEPEKEFVFLNDINNNLDERKSLMNMDGAIIVAETEKTKYANVNDLMTIVSNYQIPVIGSIVKS